MEERLYKLELATLRVIPMLLAAVSLLNASLSYFDIDIPLLSYIGGVSLLPLIFLYLSSYAFRFCAYHRMFLHYVSANWVLTIIDLYIGIPVSDRAMYTLYMMLAGIFFFLLLYYHQKCKRDGSLYR